MNLHIYPSTFQFESRILKETQSIAKAGLFGRIVVVAHYAANLPEQEQLDDVREVWRVPCLVAGKRGLAAKAVRHVEWMLRVLWRCWGKDIECVNCHSLSVLPLALALRWGWGAELIYDTHELETETLHMVGVRQRCAKWLERFAMPSMRSVIVVSDSIAQWYRRTYGLANVYLVRNAPDIQFEDMPAAVDLKAHFAIPSDHVLCLYQGLLTKGRGIEQLIAAFRGGASDKHVVFLGYGSLVDLVQRNAAECPQIHFHPAVPPQRIAAYTAAADIGLCLIEDCCLSYRYSLPNKLFEYLCCGVPVLTSNLPDMSALLRDKGQGWVVDEGKLGEFLATVTAAEVALKSAALFPQRSSFTWAQEEPELLRAYRHGDGSSLQRRVAA